MRPDGSVAFLEVNVAPGMTETSLLPQSAEAAGHELGALYRALVETALRDARSDRADGDGSTSQRER